MLKTTSNGYTFLPVKREHILNWGGFGVCDFCNGDIEHEGYLVFVLNSSICPDCFNNWLKTSKKYQEDLDLQEAHQSMWYDYHIRAGKIALGSH